MGIFFRSLRSPVRLNNTFYKRKVSDDFLIYFELFCTEDIKNRVQVLHLNLFAYFRKDTPDNVKYTIRCFFLKHCWNKRHPFNIFRSSFIITGLLIINLNFDERILYALNNSSQPFYEIRKFQKARPKLMPTLIGNPGSAIELSSECKNVIYRIRPINRTVL